LFKRISLNRRSFLRTCSAGALAVLGSFNSRYSLAEAADASVKQQIWNPLRRMQPVTPDALTLHAAITEVDSGTGVNSTAWLLNESLPSPLIRTRKGERFRVTLKNSLPDSLILHWHGLTQPEKMDGHPHLAIPQGERYEYDFTMAF